MTLSSAASSTKLEARLHALCACVVLALAVFLSGCGSGIVKTGESYFEPITDTTLYTAFGDSITAAVPLTVRSWPAYPAALGPSMKMTTSDYAYSGDQACDLFPHQIQPNNIGHTVVPRTLYSVMVGTNDVVVKGTGAYEQVYKTCLDAALTWLGTTRSDKLLAGDDGVAVSGGCNATPDPGHYGGMYCTPGTSGAVTVDQFFTLGHPLYIWYSYNDVAGANSALNVAVDGGSPTTVLGRPPVRMLTQNGTQNSIGVLRLAVAPGMHRVVMSTTTGDVAVLGMGSTRSPNAPVLFLGDIPCQLVDNPLAPLQSQLQYSSDVVALFFTELTDGLKIYFAPDRLWMLGTPAEMADQLHPNALGQQHLASAFGVAVTNSVNYGDLILPK